MPLTLTPADGGAARPVWAPAVFSGGATGAAGTLPAMKPHHFEGQVGGFGAYLEPDYAHSVNTNAGIYAVFSGNHVGMEAEGSFTVVNRGGIHENTFAIGPRFQMPTKYATFYLKAQVGTGSISYSKSTITNSNNILLLEQYGGGVDVKLMKHLKLRAADFSYQIWPVFYPRGLTPYSISSGLAIAF